MITALLVGQKLTNLKLTFKRLGTEIHLRIQGRCGPRGHVGFGMFRQQMQYKSEKFGCTLVVADRWFPSSKRCHMCGNVKEKLGLSERTYVCEACGLVEDRDVNAAINLEQYPRLVGNLTPVDTRTKARRQRRASSVVEAGTNPCAQVRTIQKAGCMDDKAHTNVLLAAGALAIVVFIDAYLVATGQGLMIARLVNR